MLKFASSRPHRDTAQEVTGFWGYLLPNGVITRDRRAARPLVRHPWSVSRTCPRDCSRFSSVRPELNESPLSI